MRSYTRNSPESAARVVALVLISDGHVCRSEIETLQQLQIETELGLAPDAFARVIQTLCEDLLMSAYGGGSMMRSIDEATLAALLSEVDDPGLQGKVLRLASAAAEADQHLDETEALVVAAARQQWQISGQARTTHSPAPALQPT